MPTEMKRLDLNQDSTNSSSPNTNLPTSVKNLPTNKQDMNKKTLYIIASVVIIFGIASGYGLNILSRTRSSQISGEGGGMQVSSSIKVGYSVGSEDTKAFKDSAEGVVEKGGLEGEGSHKLLRPGGPSQTVYLTSSVIDLDEFAGHKVKIWGETFAAQKAGWLMDVGRVEVLELNAKVE